MLQGSVLSELRTQKSVSGAWELLTYRSSNYEAARIDVCRAVSRWRKACRCSRRETISPIMRRERK
jgi:hypothetical protein